MSYTKGPWRVCGGMTPKYTGIVSDKGYIVFEMGDYSQHYENGAPVNAPSYLEQRANAQLMASAPELLEALEMLINCVVEECDTVIYPFAMPVEAARAALAKAKGEQQ